MKLEGVKISGTRRLIHGSHGPIKLRRRLGLMQPKLRVGDGLGGLDQPDAGLWKSALMEGRWPGPDPS